MPYTMRASQAGRSLALLMGATIVLLACAGGTAVAQGVPGAIDPGRIRTDPQGLLPAEAEALAPLPDHLVATAYRAPEGAETVRISIGQFNVVGATALSPQDLSDIYGPYLGHEMPLSVLWRVASDITDIYRARGMLLSRAYIPAQDVTKGTVTIAVIEGYIHNVVLEGPGIDLHPSETKIVQTFVDQITAERPSRLATLESAALRLNDIPGLSFRTVLKPAPEAPEGGITVVLQAQRAPGRGAMSFDNHASRYSGIYQASFAYQASLLPLQTTTLSGVVGVPDPGVIASFTLAHSVYVAPEWTVNAEVSQSRSEPVYRLEHLEIDGRSIAWRAGTRWQPLRSRLENLSFALDLYLRNSSADLLGDPGARDRVRAVELSARYGARDPLDGANILDVALRQGISGLGASAEGDSYLSRSQAVPDFRVLALAWSRQDFIAPDWLVRTTLAGQLASDPLYSSEEFGFGGPYLGRAYEESEILGDEGLAGSVEVQWHGMNPRSGVQLVPSIFYDLGKVWNIDDEQTDASAASAGVALRAVHRSGVSADLSLAWPLTRPASTPVYGANESGPRLFFGLRASF